MQHPEEGEDEVWIYNGQKEVPATVRRVKIAEGITRIPDWAFKEHRQLEEVILSSSTVQVIGKRAFCSCKKLKSILYQGPENEEVGIPSSVRLIDECAFFGCKLLARLVLKEGLERIGVDAFYGCESWTEVEIPSTVKVIDDWAFNKCKLLAIRLVLNHEGLERIGSHTFAECESLSHVRIPQSVKIIIATDAFVECSSMISIELPEERSFNIDLSGCLSLVSVVGPISIFFQDEEDREEFFQSSKLASLVDDEDDLIRKLNHRFDNSPLNKLCYYQAYQSLDVAMVQLHSLMEEHPPLAATTQVDEFGMTPLHVLSLSQTTNLDMLLAVMDAGKPGHMVRNRDSFGSTPMEYLCMNRMPGLNDVIRRLFQTRFEQVLGLDQFWEVDMVQAIDEALAVEWSLRKSEVIGRVVRKFERKEILSLLELWLWKVKIDEVIVQSEQMLRVGRQRCRIMSGAAVVIPHVLPFLDSNQQGFLVASQ
eukprot:scaffold636_cov64-Cylindrotheca_fusiformis.AAC.4